MNTIWKFPLTITDHQTITVPRSFMPLTVQFQGPVLCLWAMVDPNEAMNIDPLNIYIVGTGNPGPPEDAQYLGTAQQSGGALVWHVFFE